MARLTDAILNPNVGFAQGRQAPMLDLKYGGQMGFASDLTQWVSTQAHIRRNLICLLVEAPRGFQMLGADQAKWVATLRALVELHAIRIDGLNQTLTVEVQDTSPVGGAGEQHEDFTNVTRERSRPVFSFVERYGRPVNSFFSAWIELLMMHPETKTAGLASVATSRPTDLLADVYSATMAFIEPDPTHTKVNRSWLCTNMFPQSAGEVVGRRELTAAGEPVNYDISFTATTQVGAGVDAFCQTLLDGISIVGANPTYRPAFLSGISADVTAVAEGYRANVENLGASAVRV